MIDRSKIVRTDGATERDSRVYTFKAPGVKDPVDARSVTSVLNYEPEGGYYLAEWFKKHGEECDRIRDEAALVGTVAHNTIEKMCLGEKVETEWLINELKRGLADLSAIHDPRKLSHSSTLLRLVQKNLQGFVNFWTELKPETIAVEQVVYSLDVGTSSVAVAGSLDWQGTIGGVPTIIDWKTSNSIHQSHLVQSSFYGYCLWGEDQKGRYQGDDWYVDKQIGVCQIGNNTKQLFTWKVIPNKHRNGKCVPGFVKRFAQIADLHAFDFPKVKPVEKTVYPATWSL